MPQPLSDGDIKIMHGGYQNKVCSDPHVIKSRINPINKTYYDDKNICSKSEGHFPVIYTQIFGSMRYT